MICRCQSSLLIRRCHHPPPTHPNRLGLGMAKLIGPGQPHAVSDVGCEPMLNTHSSQAFRFGTRGDLVDIHHTHTPHIHQRCIVPLTIQHPSIPPRTLLLDYCASTVHATARSLTRIRNQRPAGVVRHWKRTILYSSLLLAACASASACACACAQRSSLPRASQAFNLTQVGN